MGALPRDGGNVIAEVGEFVVEGVTHTLNEGFLAAKTAGGIGGFKNLEADERLIAPGNDDFLTGEGALNEAGKVGFCLVNGDGAHRNNYDLVIKLSQFFEYLTRLGLP